MTNALGLFPEEDDNTIYFSRSDANDDFSSTSLHSFFLDEKTWPSVEHYYQANKFSDATYQEKIRLSPTPEQAKKLGGTRFKRRRKDWKKIKTTIMTRALYTKCRTYSHIAENLLASQNKKLVENSQYDYFWGCGRDRRGENHYGKILMNIRHKLSEEAKQ